LENIHFAGHASSIQSFNSSKDKYFVTITINNFKKYSNIVAADIDQIQYRLFIILPLIAYDPRESVLWSILVIYSFPHFRILISNLSDQNVFYLYILCIEVWYDVTRPIFIIIFVFYLYFVIDYIIMIISWSIIWSGAKLKIVRPAGVRHDTTTIRVFDKIYFLIMICSIIELRQIL